MNTAGTTGNPEASAHDRELYVRADALLRLPLPNRQQALKRIEKEEGESIANELKAEIFRLWESRQARLSRS